MEIPRLAKGNFPWLGTLPSEIQDEVWEADWQWFQDHITQNFEKLIFGYAEQIEALEAMIQSNEFTEFALEDFVLDRILDADGDEVPQQVEEYEEMLAEIAHEVEQMPSVNPFTGESIITVRDSDLKVINRSLRARELIDLYKRISSDLEVMILYQWDLRWSRLLEVSEGDLQETEWELVEPLCDDEALDTLFDSYHLFYGRDPEDQRNRERYLSLWREADAQRRTGNSEPYEELIKPTQLALEMAERGSRITNQMGDCYICKKLVMAGDGELLLWNEIPKMIREEFIPGVFKKWHVRHFHEPCMQEQYGKRIPLAHVKEVTEYRNQKSEPCWMCGVEVSAGDGWLVLVDNIPKWKQQKRAFPGARRKKYYVQCCRG